MSPIIIGCHFSRHKKDPVSDTLVLLNNMFGARTGQIFVGSPMSRLSEKSEARWYKEAPEIKKTLSTTGMKLFVHSPYTLNFAKDAKEEDGYWITALMKEMRIAHAIGAEGCVLHMGKAVKLNTTQAEAFFHQNLVTVLDTVQAEKLNVKLFVETSAGQGTELYPTRDNSLDNLARFYNAFTPSQKQILRLCVDTCHVYAAGMDLSTAESVKRFWDDWERLIGVENLAVIHINNSSKAQGSRADRHANILEGKIPREGLSAFIKAAKKHAIPMILETPNCQFDIVNVLELSGHEKTRAMSYEEWYRAAAFQQIGV